MIYGGEFMKTYCKSLKNVLLFSIIIAIQLFVTIYFELQKDSLFGDELFSYAFANAFYTNTVNNPTNSYTANAFVYFHHWLDCSVWKHMFTVQDGQQFNYASVIYNQEFDISPPLHTLVLHTICSFFPDIFSKWFSYSINAAFFIFAQIVLFKIGNCLFTDSRISLLVCTIYGFSWGGINTVVYLRMYMMVVFFALLLIYAAIKVYDNATYNTHPTGLFVLAFVAAFGGILTHMHFLIFSFFVGLIFVGLFWTKGLWKSGLIFGLSLLCSVIAAFLVYPRIMEVLFGKGNAGFYIDPKYYDVFSVFKTYFRIINYELFGYLGNAFLLLLFLSIVIRLIVNYRKERKALGIIDSFDKSINDSIVSNTKNNRIIFTGICLVVLATFGFICFFTVYMANRYMYIFYPFLTILMVGFIAMFHKRFIIIFYASMVLLIYNFSFYNTGYLHAYERGQSVIAGVFVNENVDAVVIQKAESFWPLIWRGEMLMEAENSFLTTVERLDESVEEIKDKELSKQNLIVYIAENVKTDHDVLISKFTKDIDFKYFEKLCDIAGSTYVLTKE